MVRIKATLDLVEGRTEPLALKIDKKIRAYAWKADKLYLPFYRKVSLKFNIYVVARYISKLMVRGTISMIHSLDSSLEDYHESDVKEQVLITIHNKENEYVNNISYGLKEFSNICPYFYYKGNELMAGLDILRDMVRFPDDTFTRDTPRKIIPLPVEPFSLTIPDNINLQDIEENFKKNKT